MHSGGRPRFYQRQGWYLRLFTWFSAELTTDFRPSLDAAREPEESPEAYKERLRKFGEQQAAAAERRAKEEAERKERQRLEREQGDLQNELSIRYTPLLI